MISTSSCPTEGQSVPGQKWTAVATKLSLAVQLDVKKLLTSIKHKMCHKWKDEFPWLTIREGGKALGCSLCCNAPNVEGKSQLLTGCTKPKKEPMQKHGASSGYLHGQEVAVQMMTAYFIAKKELPLSKFLTLMNL